MNTFWTVLGAVLPVFCIRGAGFAIRKKGWLTEEADESLLRLTINLLVPALIFDSILGNRALEKLDNVLLSPLVGFGTVGLGIVIALLLLKTAGLTRQPKGNTFAFTTGVYNYGYVPLPLALLLFDQETVGVLFVHNVGVEIALWTLGMMMLSGGSIRSGWKHAINPPVISIVAALSLNFLGGGEWIPQFLLTMAKMLGQCAVPLGLVLVGATIADRISEFHADMGWRVMATSCLVRLGIMPMLFLLLARYLPCAPELKRVIVLQAAMPAAVFPIIMAKHYGGHTNTAMRVVLGTSAVSLITIPLWIRFGIKFVGL